jgi:hypothetical protein
MDAELEELFSQSIQRAQRSNFVLTPKAIVLLHLTIESIAEEPRNRWLFPERLDVQNAQQRAIRRIPSYTAWIAQRHGHDLKFIGVFELLDVAPQLLAAFCLFEDPPD